MKTLWRAMIDACHEDDLDKAIAPIQEILGQDDGGPASIFFSGPNGENWPRLTPSERAPIIRKYVESELHEPEWRVGIESRSDASVG